jgi:hypothetical protein
LTEVSGNRGGGFGEATRRFRGGYAEVSGNRGGGFGEATRRFRGTPLAPAITKRHLCVRSQLPTKIGERGSVGSVLGCFMGSSRRFRGSKLRPNNAVFRIRAVWSSRGEGPNSTLHVIISEVSGKLWMSAEIGSNLSYAKARQNWAAR